jgi:hypothetical protein
MDWSWVDFSAGALFGYWLMPPVVRWINARLFPAKPKPDPT